jgi:hypothetical protein
MTKNQQKKKIKKGRVYKKSKILENPQYPPLEPPPAPTHKKKNH